MAPNAPAKEGVPVWVYVIFRKNPSTGHDNMSINISQDGPVFWNRHVIYVFACSCHFEKHEPELIDLMDRFQARIERVCLVDKPVDYSFLPDSFFRYLATALPRLQFVYLRELNLERLNRATVEQLSHHGRLQKLIVHGCQDYEVLQDFCNLPQLLVVKGDIIGLKHMIGDFDTPPGLATSTSSASTASSTSVSEIGSPPAISEDGPGPSSVAVVRPGSPIAVSSAN